MWSLTPQYHCNIIIFTAPLGKISNLQEGKLSQKGTQWFCTVLPTAEQDFDHSGSHRPPSTYLTEKGARTPFCPLQQRGQRWDFASCSHSGCSPCHEQPPPTLLLLLGRLHCFGGTVSVCYSLWTPMGLCTESTAKCTSPLGQRNALVCPAKQHCCQAATVHTGTRFVLWTQGPAPFKQPAKKTSEKGFTKHLMSA